jgi:hypothetical protein
MELLNAVTALLGRLWHVCAGGKRWKKNLPAVLLAERTSIYAPTGVTPFSLIYGREAILPYETRYPVWRLMDWEKTRTREELLTLRARQLQLRDEDMEEIILRKRRFREQGKEAFDAKSRLRLKSIKKGDIVLVYHSKRAIDITSDNKLNFRWMGPYRVSETFEKGYYTLEEMDGAKLKGTYAGNRLKKFVYMEGAFQPVQESDSEDSDTNSSNGSESWEDDSARDEGLYTAAPKTHSQTGR